MNLNPQHFALSDGRQVALFPDPNLQIVRIDFSFAAGSAFQPYYLVAGCANQIFTEGSLHHSAAEIAEFIDFRGISIEKGIDNVTASLTVYVLRKYASEFFPLLREMLVEPAFRQEEFDLYCAKRRQALLAGLQKTAFVARNLFYESLFGPDHIYGGAASPADVDRLRLEDVRQFYASHYQLGSASIIISGQYDDELLADFNAHFSVPDRKPAVSSLDLASLVANAHPSPVLLHRAHVPSPQSTVRLGRLLPFAWDHPDYARFLVLNTVLGGYFGSRLMTNIREDKGYTYGIYSQSQIFRHCIVFFITADVAVDHTQDAINEIYKELDILRNELISPDELNRVRSYMKGDFLRSIDGIFERAERFKQMEAAGVDERFSSNLLQAIDEVSPEMLRSLAQQVFTNLVEVAVGGFPVPQE